MISIIPPRTMSDVWREERARTKKLEDAVSGYSVGIGFTSNSIDRRGTYAIKRSKIFLVARQP